MVLLTRRHWPWLLLTICSALVVVACGGEATPTEVAEVAAIASASPTASLTASPAPPTVVVTEAGHVYTAQPSTPISEKRTTAPEVRTPIKTSVPLPTSFPTSSSLDWSISSTRAAFVT